MQSLRSKIAQFLLPSGKFGTAKALSHLRKNPDLYEALVKRTNYLQPECKITERCYHVLNGLTSRPICCICSSQVVYSCGKYNLTCGSKECHTKLRVQNAAATMRNNGIYEKTGIAHKVRMSDPKMKEKHSRNIAKALSTPDLTGIKPSQKAATSLRNTLAKNPDIISKRESKKRKTMEATGRWLSYDELDAATAYRLKVHSITMKQPLHLLENFHLRGPSASDHTVQNFHIDHIFSVMDGFKNNVPPEVIGHFCNLRMLHHRENVKKNGKSDITLEELYLRYNQHA